MTRFALLFILLATLRATAVPAPDTVEIFKMSTEQSISARDEYTSLTKRVVTTCQNNPGQTASVDDAAACVAFLNSLGTTPCTINGPNVVFCRSGNVIIAGSNDSGDINTVSSFCSDVAIGAQNIINSCTMPNGQVEGFAAANGNGFIVVSIRGSKSVLRAAHTDLLVGRSIKHHLKNVSLK